MCISMLSFFLNYVYNVSVLLFYNCMYLSLIECITLVISTTIINKSNYPHYNKGIIELFTQSSINTPSSLPSHHSPLCRVT